MEGRGESESNNVLVKQFTIKNYVPGLPFMLMATVILIIITLAGVIGFFFLDRRDSWFLLLLAPGLTGLFALLFYIPLEQTSTVSSSTSPKDPSTSMISAPICTTRRLPTRVSPMAPMFSL